MKIVTNLVRVIIGLTFIFSGFVKLDDPTGFSYKLDEYFSVFAGDVEATQDTIGINSELGDNYFTYKRGLFISDATVPYSSEVSLKRAPGTNEGDDSIWAGNYTVHFDGQMVVSKDFILADSSMTVKGISEITIGDKVVKTYTDVLDINSNGKKVSESVEVTAYVKPNSWLVGFFNGLKPYAMAFGIFVSVLELLLGFALLIGWKARFTSVMVLLLTLFFTFLTWYSWKFDKVTDCGCFGDAIPLNPYESFIKNLIFLGLILIALFWAKKIKPIFSNPFAVKVMAVVVLLSGGFAMYCKYYLPVIDFLKFKEGNNICELMNVPEGERKAPWKITQYEYLDADGNPILVEYDSDKNSFDPPFQSGWKFSKTLGEKVLEEAYEPPIHDFIFMDLQQNNNYIDEFLAGEQKLLVVMHDLDKVNRKAIPKIKALAEQWTKEGKPFWALTASSADKAEAFRHEHNLTFDIYLGDNTNLKSIIRSNPGLLLFTDTCKVKKVWPSTRLPKYKKIQKLTK